MAVPSTVALTFCSVATSKSTTVSSGSSAMLGVAVPGLRLAARNAAVAPSLADAIAAGLSRRRLLSPPATSSIWLARRARLRDASSSRARRASSAAASMRCDWSARKSAIWVEKDVACEFLQGMGSSSARGGAGRGE